MAGTAAWASLPSAGRRHLLLLENPKLTFVIVASRTNSGKGEIGVPALRSPSAT
jgi:hypothetical protein